MNKTILILVLLNIYFFYATASQKSNVAVRLASLEDLKAIIALDSNISTDHFKPIFLQYPEFKDKESEVERILADELETDMTWFTSCIAMEKQQCLYVALHDATPVGFAACHKEDDTTVVIDLMLIHANYRGKGIGKQLIKSSLQTFPKTSTCMLVVLDKNQQARTSYEKMGFTLMDRKPSFVQKKYPESRYLCYSLFLNAQQQ